LGMIFVRISGNDPKRGLNQGTVATTVIFSFLALLSAIFLGIKPVLGVFLPTLAGLLAGIIIGFTSDRFTDIDRPAVQNTAHAAKTGPAVLILEGFSYGLFSIVPSILGICLALVTAWFTAEYFGIAGTYGVSVAAVGLLSITGMIVSADLMVRLWITPRVVRRWLKKVKKQLRFVIGLMPPGIPLKR